MSWLVGPNEQEMAVYEALVDNGPLTSTEIATLLRIEESAAEDVLCSLRGKRLATRGPVGIYAASPPDLALGAILEQHTQQVNQVRGLLDDLDRRYRRRGTAMEVDRSIEILNGREIVAERADQLMASAQDSIWAMAEEVDFRLQPEEGYDSLREALARSIDHRVIVKASSLTYPDALQRIRMARGHTSMHRAVPSVPSRMLIVDHHTAMLPVVNPVDVEGTMVIVRSSPILAALIALFEEFWARGRTIGLDDEDVEGSDELSPDDVRVLGLLINGLTNSAIATQLDMSQRTVQRRVTALMQRTSATSRVQLGYEAGVRGWLTKP